MPVNVVSEWLNACSGCEISILNTGEALLDLLFRLTAFRQFLLQIGIQARVLNGNGSLVGDAAVYKVLSWTGGNFQIDFEGRSKERSTTLSTQGLLMEGLRLLDVKPGEQVRFEAINRPGRLTYPMLLIMGVGPLYLTVKRLS